MSGYKEIIPEELTPHHIDYLKAKSKDYGGDTLAEHTWAVLRRLHDQYILRPNLAEQIGVERLWHRMYWGCFLHDFGKAAEQFQQRLEDTKVDNQWKTERHRHEVLSLGFVDWLFPRGHIDRNAIICIIASHHKDYWDIDEKYGFGFRTATQKEFVEFLANQISAELADDLWQWLVDYGQEWQEYLGFPALETVQAINRDAFGYEAIINALDDFDDVIRRYGDTFSYVPVTEFLYRGLIFTSDHSASAASPPFPPMSLTASIAQEPFVQGGFAPNTHQQRTANWHNGSALLIAPTGSGKTEAALLWAAQQIELSPSSRLFYTLPYQASMNAMAKRLTERYFDTKLEDENNEQVTIQHSRATLHFYELLRDADSGIEASKATEKAKGLKNKTRLNYYPIQVFSPYQMLKASFQLKGYESLLLDFANALFIFDEIHAYDPERLALIISTIEWLAREYHARFLVMTATMPPMIRKRMMNALNLSNSDVIVASDEDFKASQRHIVRIIDGEMQNHINKIVEDFRDDKAVLVCCNQVARAQEIYNLLFNEIQENDLMLLHGRFNGRDRGEKEKILADCIGVGSETRKNMIVVATQVVEVSLDVDFDVLYTEPAPLSALLQRFGRVNRAKRYDRRPVYIFSEPSDDKGAMPYKGNIVRRSLEVLKKYCENKPIDEAQVTSMLEEIYADEEILSAWEKAYDSKAEDFRKNILQKMKPYQSADDKLKQRFYQMFDGTQVLPFESVNDFYDALEEGGFLAASGYLVNVSWGQYHMMGKLVKPDPDGFVDQVDVPYSSKFGLDIAGALQRKDEDV